MKIVILAVPILSCIILTFKNRPPFPKRSGARIVSAQSSANANDNVKTMFMRKKSMKFIAENLIATATRETK